MVAGDFLFGAVNSTFEASTGLASASVIGRTLQDVLPGGLADDIVDRCRHCLSGAPPTPFMRIMPLPAGRTPWELLLRWCFDESGALAGIYVSAREISERHEPQVEHTDRSGAEADRLPNIRFTAFPDGRLDRLDPAFLAMAGLPLDSNLETAAALVCPEDLARLTPPADCDMADHAYETDVRLRGPGGLYRWFRVRAELVEGLAGRRWYGVAIDIDAKRKRILETEKSVESAVDVFSGFGGCGVIIDRQWRVANLTPEAAAWIGKTEAQLQGVDCRERLPIPKALVKAVEASLAAQTPLQIEIPAPNRPGRWMEFRIHPFAAGATIVFRDITEQRSLNERMRSAIGQAHGLLDASILEMALLDSDGVIVSVNAAWRQMASENQVGGATDGIGTFYPALCKKSIPGLDEAALKVGMSEVLADRPGRVCAALRDRHAERPVVAAAADHPVWPRALGATHRHPRGYHRCRPGRGPPCATLRSSCCRRWRMSGSGSPSSCTRNSTSQHLAALGLGLIRLKRLVGNGAGDLIADMRTSVKETVREIRVLSYLMKPSELERGDLESAAQHFLSGFAARTGLNAEFRATGSFRGVAETVQSAVFRVLQEALSNVYRHANARRVEVDLTNGDGTLSVRIADDGRGIPVLRDGQLTIAPGVGFASMESRVTQLDGTLKISRGEVGTVVEASIPLVQPGRQA